MTKRCLVNLLENATRYTPAGSRVDIVAREKASGIEIRVSDNGPGFPPGIEELLFQKFVRGESTSPDSRRGVGLGLAICRGIVQAHAGTIRAHIRPEGGAEFIINLPARQRPPEVKLES